jgi:hypothetical protein
MSTIIIVDMRLRQLGLGRFFPHIQDRYGILNLKFIDPKQNAGFADSKRNYWQRWRQQKHVVCSTTLSKGCPQPPGCRQTAPYAPELEPDLRPNLTQLRHRTPPAWIRFCTPFGDSRRWQHDFALDGSITLHLVAAWTLHWVAELIAFSTFSCVEKDFATNEWYGSVRETAM